MIFVPSLKQAILDAHPLLRPCSHGGKVTAV